MRQKGWLHSIIGKEIKMLPTITSLLVVLALLFGGTGATVYAAQDSLPTDLLYPVKTISEDLRYELLEDPQAKFDLLTGFIQNRFMEYNLLAAAGEPAPEEWADRVATQTQLMINLAAHMDDAPLTQNMAKLMNMIQVQVRVMETDNLPDEVDPAADSVRIMLQDRIQLATQGVEEPNLLRTRIIDSDKAKANPPSFTPGPGAGPGPAGSEEAPGPYGPGQDGEAEELVPGEGGYGPGGSEEAPGPYGLGPDGDGVIPGTGSGTGTSQGGYKYNAPEEPGSGSGSGSGKK
jgi:hypothetical protein